MDVGGSLGGGGMIAYAWFILVFSGWWVYGPVLGLHRLALGGLRRPALGHSVGTGALLGRLDDNQLDQAYTLLAGTFGLGDAHGREQRIALTGLRGAGKSTLGAQLAAHRGVPAQLCASSPR